MARTRSDNSKSSQIERCLDGLIAELHDTQKSGKAQVTVNDLLKHVLSVYDFEPKPAQISQAFGNALKAHKLAKIDWGVYGLPGAEPNEPDPGSFAAMLITHLKELPADTPAGAQMGLCLNGTAFGRGVQLLSPIDSYKSCFEKGKAGQLRVIVLSPTRWEEIFDRTKFRGVHLEEFEQSDKFVDKVVENFKTGIESALELLSCLQHLSQQHERLISLRVWLGPAIDPFFFVEDVVSCESRFSPDRGCADSIAVVSRQKSLIRADCQRFNVLWERALSMQGVNAWLDESKEYTGAPRMRELCGVLFGLDKEREHNRKLFVLEALRHAERMAHQEWEQQRMFRGIKRISDESNQNGAATKHRQPRTHS